MSARPQYHVSIDLHAQSRTIWGTIDEDGMTLVREDIPSDAVSAIHMDVWEAIADAPESFHVRADGPTLTGAAHHDGVCYDWEASLHRRPLTGEERAMLADVAALVAERATIDHGSIRCLYSEAGVRSIESVEDCDEVETGTIGDDALADRLLELASSGQSVHVHALEELEKLEREYFGGGIEDLIEAAENFEDGAKHY